MRAEDDHPLRVAAVVLHYGTAVETLPWLERSAVRVRLAAPTRSRLRGEAERALEHDQVEDPLSVRADWRPHTVGASARDER
jgi:hypothetical protein